MSFTHELVLLTQVQRETTAYHTLYKNVRLTYLVQYIHLFKHNYIAFL